MPMTRASCRAIAILFTITRASSFNVRCLPGTKVFSLAVWSRGQIDGLYMRCTGSSEEQAIPAQFDDEPGGDKYDGICAGTGGLRSFGWDIPSASNYIMVHGNITCMDNKTHFFADKTPRIEWAINASRSVSCQEGEYVHGLTYHFVTKKKSPFPYFLTDVGVMCSTAALDPICTVCSGDTILRSAEDQPKDCAHAVCTEAEYCKPIGEPGTDYDALAKEKSFEHVLEAILGVVTVVLLSVCVCMRDRLRDDLRHGPYE